MEAYNTLNDVNANEECLEVMIKNTKSIYNDEFKKEANLRDLLYDNIELFIKNQFNDECKEAHKEYQYENRIKIYNKRIDLYVKAKKHDYIIEIKKPIYISGNLKAIGQLLNYGRCIGTDRTKMVLITTKFDKETALTIDRYKLPITYIYFSKDKTLQYKGWL